MKEIIEISFINRKKAKILFDGGSSLVLYAGEIKKLGWKEGDEIPDDQAESVRKDIVEKRAKLYVMHLLQDQDRTEKELLDKLRRAEYDPVSSAAAVEYVKGYGYVDDARYAENYVRRFSGTRSVRAMKHELKKKGIDPDLIGNALEEGMSDGGEYQAVYRALKKRHYQPPAEPDKMKAAKERDRQRCCICCGRNRHCLQHDGQHPSPGCSVG